MSRSKRPRNSALLIACLLAISPAMAQQGDPNAGILSQPVLPEAMPRTETECRAYAIQKANEEFMAQDSAVRRNSPFQTGPGGTRDPYTDSRRQQLNMDRSVRERQLYDSCAARLNQKQ